MSPSRLRSISHGQHSRARRAAEWERRPRPAGPHLARARQKSRCLPPPTPSPRRAVIITSSLFLLRSLGKEPENSNSRCRGRLSYKTLRWVAPRLATTLKKPLCSSLTLGERGGGHPLPARTPRPRWSLQLLQPGTSGPSPPPRPPRRSPGSPHLSFIAGAVCVPTLDLGEGAHRSLAVTPIPSRLSHHNPPPAPPRPPAPPPREPGPLLAGSSGEFHTSVAHSSTPAPTPGQSGVLGSQATTPRPRRRTPSTGCPRSPRAPAARPQPPPPPTQPPTWPTRGSVMPR
jgi:hypothetical protein